jgi:hypothetical protein
MITHKKEVMKIQDLYLSNQNLCNVLGPIKGV